MREASEPSSHQVVSELGLSYATQLPIRKVVNIMTRAASGSLANSKKRPSEPLKLRERNKAFLNVQLKAHCGEGPQRIGKGPPSECGPLEGCHIIGDNSVDRSYTCLS